MRGSCLSCRHWLQHVDEFEELGWCLLPVVVETQCDPPNIHGYIHEGSAGIETHKAAICDGYENGFADDVKKPKKK